MVLASIVNVRLLVMLAVSAIFAAASYGFAGTNTVDATKAGDGSAGISGYAITAVRYTLNSTNPANIDSVAFTIAPSVNQSTGTVKVRLVTSGSWFGCTSTTGTAWSCTTTGVTVSAADSLQVVAAQ